MQAPRTNNKEDELLNSRNLEFRKPNIRETKCFSSLLTSDGVAVSSLSVHCTYVEYKRELPEDPSCPFHMTKNGREVTLRAGKSKLGQRYIEVKLVFEVKNVFDVDCQCVQQVRVQNLCVNY